MQIGTDSKVQYSWTEFIRAISELYATGKTEIEISQELGGSNLAGIGMIERVETDTAHAPPFIQVRMPRVEIPIKQKVIIADFLCLNFDELMPGSERLLKNGKALQFVTEIIESNGPFPGIAVTEHVAENKVIVMPGTRGKRIA